MAHDTGAIAGAPVSASNLRHDRLADLAQWIATYALAIIFWIHNSRHQPLL